MKNKVGLSQVSMMVVLAILLSLASAYVPMFSILSIAIPVPFAIVGTLSNKKFYILSAMTTFFILMFTVNIGYAINITIMKCIPGLIIGSIAKENIKEEDYNKFDPIYGGTIIFVISTIIIFFIADTFFEVNMLKTLTEGIELSVKAQMEILKNTDNELMNSISVEDMVMYAQSMLPLVLFFASMIQAFVVYSLEVFILRRINKLNLEKPSFMDFYLPGNAVSASLMMYIIVFLLDMLNLGLNTEVILLNIQLIFTTMFVIQGVSTCIHFFRKWIKDGPSKMSIVAIFAVSLTGFMGISLVGMLDSIVDFRKVRRYKST